MVFDTVKVEILYSAYPSELEISRISKGLRNTHEITERSTIVPQTRTKIMEVSPYRQ
jgi:hypothetical protein